MSGKQIVGIILIIAGLLVGGLGLVNVLDLVGVDSNNPILKMGLAMGGTSMESLWAKYGGMLAGGILILFVGIALAKKPAVA